MESASPNVWWAMGADVRGITAVVVTHMRPHLAGDLVLSLLDDEGLAPDQIVVVVNEAGGLEPPELEQAVRMRRLEHNLGPAGGFRAGMLEAFADPTCVWAYLCEDDVGLFDLPVPRLAELRRRVEELGPVQPPVGAVVAYGRRFTGRSGHAPNFVPPAGVDFAPVDVAAWGATLLSRTVFEAGVLPDPEWFFGYEDFDFFCRVREAGLAVVVDGRSARQIEAQQTSIGRDRAVGGRRPTDTDEPWRAYYLSRNFFALARRHGHRSWLAWHLLYSLRRMQLARGGAHSRATVRGLVDGALGRLGERPGYSRSVGETPER